MVLPNFWNLLFSLIPFWKAALALVLECYVSSLRQDPTIGSKNKNKVQFMQFTQEVPVLECYFLKHSQGILGDYFFIFFKT
jgi:hypothetical protein